jgi:hypothetical protein
VPLVGDFSSTILSRPIDVRAHGLIYAGAQKNIGPSGLVLLVIRATCSAAPGSRKPRCSATPRRPRTARCSTRRRPCRGTSPAWCSSGSRPQGGLTRGRRAQPHQGRALYAAIDGSGGYYRNPVAPAARSWMNVPFTLHDEALDAPFLKESEAAGLLALKGHRAVGGMRASIYNAMPLEGCRRWSTSWPTSPSATAEVAGAPAAARRLARPRAGRRSAAGQTTYASRPFRQAAQDRPGHGEASNGRTVRCSRSDAQQHPAAASTACRADRYQVASDSVEPDAILVRSADMHKTRFRRRSRPSRAPVPVPTTSRSRRSAPAACRCSTPLGANANAVKELVLAGMLIAARNLGEALGFVASLRDYPTRTTPWKPRRSASSAASWPARRWA